MEPYLPTTLAEPLDRAHDVLRRYQSHPATETLRHALGLIRDELAKLLGENEYLRDEIVRLENRARQVLRGR